MRGEITVRKGESSATKDRWGYISGLRKKWKLNVLSLLSPPPRPPNASGFPHLFFPIAVCSSLLLKFWHDSLSLNKDDNKNLKPSYSHLKRDLVPDPTALCVCVKRREAQLCRYCQLSNALLPMRQAWRTPFPTPPTEMASGSWEHRSTHQPYQMQRLLSHFASSALSLWHS